MALSAIGATQFIVELQAKTQEFQKSVKAANDNMAKFKKNADEAGKSTNRFSAVLTRVVGPLKIFTAGIAALSGGLIALTIKSANMAENLQDMANQANTTAEKLQVMRFALDQNGSSADDADKALAKLNNQISIAILEGGTLAEAFNRIGVSVRNSDGSIRDSADVLTDIARAFENTVDPSERAALATKIFGDDLANRLLPLLKQGGDSIGDYEDRLRSMNGVMSNDTVRAASDASAKLRAMWNIVQNQLVGALAKLAPQILSFTQKLIRSLPVIAQWVQSIGELFGLIQAPIGLRLARNDKSLTDATREAAEAAEALMEAKRVQEEAANSGTLGRLGLGPGGLGQIASNEEKAKQRIEETTAAVSKLRAEREALLAEEAEYAAEQQKLKELADKLNKPIEFPDDDTPAFVPLSTESSFGGAEKTDEEKYLERIANARQSYTESLRTEIANYGELNEAIGLYNTAIEDNVVSIETLREVTNAGFEAGTAEFDLMVQKTEAINRQKEAIEELIRKQEEATNVGLQFAEGMRSQMLTLNEAANQAGGRFGQFFNDIIDGAVRGELNFKQMALSIIQDLTAMILKAMLWKALGPIFGGDGGGGILGGLFGGLLESANGNAFGAANNVIPFANGGIVGSPTFFPMNGTKTGLMGEAGPEAIMPLKRGTDGKLGVAADGSGGGVTNIFNTTINPGPNQSPADARAFAEEFNRTVDQRIAYTMNKQATRGRSSATPQRRVTV